MVGLKRTCSGPWGGGGGGVNFDGYYISGQWVFPPLPVTWYWSKNKCTGDSDSGIGYGYGGGNYDRRGGAGIASLFTGSGVVWWPSTGSATPLKSFVLEQSCSLGGRINDDKRANVPPPNPFCEPFKWGGGGGVWLVGGVGEWFNWITWLQLSTVHQCSVSNSNSTDKLKIVDIERTEMCQALQKVAV